MTKKGPLSKAEKFYIEHNRDISVSNLCKDLDRAKSAIEKFLKTLPEVVVEEKLAPAPVVKKNDTPTMSQFGRNNKGSTVMTESASMLGDDFKSKSPPKRTSKCTTSIR